MILKVEHYNKKIHGYQDDCDYVISFEDDWEEEAEALSDAMDYDNCSRRFYPAKYNESQLNQLFLCHA